MKNIAVWLLISCLSFCSRASGQGGVITTFAGNGRPGFSGDGGPAALGSLALPEGVAVDASGNLFIADTANQRIRMVSASGIISTVAGNGTQSFSGDGGPATAAALNSPAAVAVDASGNLFIADTSNNRIRKVSASGVITTFAGSGSKGFSGDNGPATAAALNFPAAVTADGSGNIFIADEANSRIRKVSADGIITTVAGSAVFGFSGDGGSATSATLWDPTGVVVDASGNLFIADQLNGRIRKVAPDGTITSVAGGGKINDPLGDGGPAASAFLYPAGLAVDAAGNVLISSFQRIRMVSTSGIITTFAGGADPINGLGDNGPATFASLNIPQGLAMDTAGNLFIADSGSERVRKVSAQVPSASSIAVSPANLAFSLVAGESSSQQLSLSGSSNVPWSASASASWITLTPSFGTGPGTISVTINTTSLQPGTYTESITISNPLAIPTQETVPVSLTVGPATISVNAPALSFQAPLGAPAQSQSLQIGGSAGTIWQAAAATSTGNAWLSVSPATGQVPAVLTVMAASAGLTTGTYRGTITIQAPGATPASITVNVTLTVIAASGPTIWTIVGDGTGGFSGDGDLATSASLSFGLVTSGAAVDDSGNLFIADWGNSRIRMVSASGIITTVAGNGTGGFSGDGGPATLASLNLPAGASVDVSGNLFIADLGNNRIRMVSTNGMITTVAGGGPRVAGSIGDGGSATSATLSNPEGVAVDGAGNLFIADAGNHRIRKVSATGIITTVAGSGSPGGPGGFSGDGGPATSAALNFTDGCAVAVDGFGNLFIADTSNNRIRKVSATGIISTVAGTAVFGDFFGDGGQATSAYLNSPRGVAVDASGNLFIGDYSNGRIRKVSATGIITTVAGSGTGLAAFGFSGDGGPATSAKLSGPQGVAVDVSGNLFIVDSGNYRIREVSGLVAAPVQPPALSYGIINTVAGNGGDGFSGDDAPAISASLNGPTAMAADVSGNLFIADSGNNRVRQVSAGGIISTVAGSGVQGFAGDGGPAASARLNNPTGVAVDASGNVFIADSGNRRIRKVSAAGITTFAGGGNALGDGGPAASASLNSPGGIAVDPAGNLFIADTGGNRVRMVSAGGTIATVAGTGFAGFSGDGGPAISAKLSHPYAVAVDAFGNIFVLDNNRIRKVSTNGIITTVAGDGATTSAGDGDLATSASFDLATGVAVDASGNLFIAERNFGRVRRVWPSGIITTAAGIGTPGFSGDGGPGPSAQLNNPGGIAIDASANLFIADTENNRVREVSTPVGAALPSITSGGVVPVGSSVPSIQPGEWVSIYGNNLANSTALWNGNFPTALGGTSVTINGKAAYLSLVSSGQINLQAPDDVVTGVVPVVVSTANGSGAATVTLSKFAPSFFLLDTRHVAGIIIRSGGSFDTVGPTGTSLGFPTVAAKSGDVVELFGTGFGPTNPAVPAGLAFSGAAPTTSPVTLLINNVSVTPSFAGLSSAGLYQINLTVPAGLGTGDVSLVATVGGVQTPSTVVISLQ